MTEKHETSLMMRSVPNLSQSPFCLFPFFGRPAARSDAPDAAMGRENPIHSVAVSECFRGGGFRAGLMRG